MPEGRIARPVATVALLATFAFGASGEARAPSFSPPAPIASDADRLFISGHSLTDRPLPDMLEAMANGAGRELSWQRQHIGGSSIRQRSAGIGEQTLGSGFAAGTDRDGNPIDVLAEFNATAATGPYDVLIITEWHRALDAMWREGTAAHLRAFQDRFIGSNPAGLTYFFAPWADLSDLADPSDWVGYERRASPIWQCMVDTVNSGLAAGGRDDRVHFIPASLALAELVARLTSGEAVAGFENFDSGEAIAQLFTDRVHLTEVGTYFVAAVTYATVFGDDAAASPLPASLDARQAESLRLLATSFVDQWREQQRLATNADCEGVPLDFIVAYTGYMEKTYARPEVGYVRARARRVRDIGRFVWTLWSASPTAAPAIVD